MENAALGAYDTEAEHGEIGPLHATNEKVDTLRQIPSPGRGK